MKLEGKAAILREYSDSVQAAIDDYDNAIQTMQAQAYESQGKSLAETQVDLVKAFKKRRGALLAAAGKRARRALLFSFLDWKKTQGADLTVTVVQKYAHELLNRGIDNRSIMSAYATPGRTAADKSSQDVTEDADDLEELKEAKEALLKAMAVIRNDRIARIEQKYDGAFTWTYEKPED